MNSMKKATAIALIAGGVVAAGAGVASATDGGAHANGKAVKSPGVVAGNLVQAPVHVPVNAVGNTVNVIGALNPTFGNDGVNR
ncbi:chaplin [Streptomyces sp. NBC_01465]|uniref:chaplin n=1 Tax=Streptomyces sp. NBC_01465 TaxID=2903878 RepID=UPI002E374BCF|nr:chaplin [Streptomyces sp. NBC_01465]